MKNEPYEIHTAEIQDLEPIGQEVQETIDKLKNNKTPDTDSMPAELRRGINTKQKNSPTCMQYIEARRDTTCMGDLNCNTSF